ncbi:relaxase/mobilization nuclease domain-containing protein [Kordiimonas laminariae]|uniref:relaxase/mobilization nuclease domain-containing protein n=1 Tax=Kordiimonas laminariae TaxID=2917717 RepID=UPI001FF6437D|nr:relaxase/mobilization nuclease domain-containing protein [Kordiimonas laminariae]MCK0070718.1 relaxase/mobilization nuclease domain-containing protein [Kordiimonas laminariae]
MILKASQRGGGHELATHLMKEENEHVEIHEMRGFIANDLKGAFDEAYAISKATRCKQYLFSLSLNPPAHEQVATPAFIRAADEVEKRLGLEGQPRAIVFHEKEGRRHAHVVWSRIGIEGNKLKAVNLPFFKRRLTELSKELYLEHGWKLPDGLKDPTLRDPTNFDLAEWQQAFRAGRDPREIKQIFQEAWQYSDSTKALNAALSESGFMLAKGDRRGFVAVDYQGEVYSLARYAGVKTKEVRERLGEPDKLPSVDEVKAKFRENITPNLKNLINQQKQNHHIEKSILQEKVFTLAKQQNLTRQSLTKRQRLERQNLQQRNAIKTKKGLLGVWEFLSGKTAQRKKEAQLKAWEQAKEHQQQKDIIILKQLAERQILQREKKRLKYTQKEERKFLHSITGKALGHPVPFAHSELTDRDLSPCLYRKRERDLQLG